MLAWIGIGWPGIWWMCWTEMMLACHRLAHTGQLLHGHIPGTYATSMSRSERQDARAAHGAIRLPGAESADDGCSRYLFVTSPICQV
jgi:hypothetical protein